MKRKQPKPLKRKFINAYFTSTLSITLVLFLLGLLGLVILNAKSFTDYVKENIGFTIVLSEDIREVDQIQLQKSLQAEPYVKAANYVAPDDAAQQFKKGLGKVFIGFLGYNPLKPTIVLKLYAAYTHNDSLLILENHLLENRLIEEVYYQRNLVNLINDNARNVSLVILGISAIMLLIFISLINNTIRLSIYSKRFIINTMQLVGATRSFIRRPFILKSLLYGVYGAIIASILLGALFLYMLKEISRVISYSPNDMLLYLFAIVLVISMLLSWISTHFAVNKFLRMRYDELFY